MRRVCSVGPILREAQHSDADRRASLHIKSFLLCVHIYTSLLRTLGFLSVIDAASLVAVPQGYLRYLLLIRTFGQQMFQATKGISSLNESGVLFSQTCMQPIVLDTITRS